MSIQDREDFTTIKAPGTTPKINSIFDFSAEALGQLKLWLEQSGMIIPASQILGAGAVNYTPSWTSTGTNPTLGNATYSLARFVRSGKMIQGTVLLKMGSTSTYGTGVYFLSLPAKASSGYLYAPIGSGFVFDDSASSLWTIVAQTDATLTKAQFTFTGAVGAWSVTPTAPFTFAVSDQIAFTFAYESAN